MGKRRFSSDDDSDEGLDGRSLSSSSTKRSRYLGGSNPSDNFNDEYIVSQGKCSVCGSDSPPTYYCIKCHRVFHEHCDNFRIENETTGICGSCLVSIILECPCCHQRGFKGIHGLRTHIGGYCKKQHSKDWRQHFKEFFVQLERRIDSIPDKEVSAVSIIRSYRQAANVVAHIYGCSDDFYKLENGEGGETKQPTLQDYVHQIMATDHSKSRKIARIESRDHDKPALAYSYTAGAGLAPQPSSQVSALSPTPSLSERPAEEGSLSSYNLRHKSSQSTSSAHGDEVFSPPPISLSPLEKNNPQNAIMDCPFCQKSGYCGLPGIRTHIRNYCPSIDKMIWREKFLKCVLFNIHKYEELNRQPDANTEYNNMVISLLKAKSNPDDPMGMRSKGSSSKGSLKENVVVGVMNPIQYEKIYCQHCHDENSGCPYCGCHTCHFKHLASLLMICDGCNREHHVYCVSPPTQIIPDGAWYCPECQKKGKELPRLQCEDRNFTLGEEAFSPQAFTAIQTLQEMVQKQAVDEKVTASILTQLSVSDLLQLQSYFSACSHRIRNHTLEWPVCCKNYCFAINGRCCHVDPLIHMN